MVYRTAPFLMTFNNP